MCGIVGYIGKKQAAPILLDGLSKLEYRGYDSAGMAIFDGKKINMAKATGRLKVLSELTHEGATLPGTVGIGHTRWATHGAPSDINAHPHFNEAGTIAVVHNGIIENYMKLKKKLSEKGYKFRSDTDTEVVAQLLDKENEGDPQQLVVGEDGGEYLLQADGRRLFLHVVPALPGSENGEAEEQRRKYGHRQGDAAVGHGGAAPYGEGAGSEHGY